MTDVSAVEEAARLVATAVGLTHLDR